MKIIGIYKITSPTNKIYIGQSIDINGRVKYYVNPNGCKEQHKLHNSIKKYGWENHVFEIIEECEAIQLNNRERYWQDFFNVIVDGLNCRLTNDGDRSGEMSQETKDKLRIANTNKVCSEETKEKIRKGNKGRKYGAEVREKVSKNHSRWNAGLSDSDVHHICKMYLSGLTSREIYKTYPNVHYCTLSEIRRKKRYKHIACLYDIPKPLKMGEKKTNRKVLCVEDDLEFNGVNEAAIYYGVSFQRISHCALNTMKVKKINKTFKYE